MIPDFFDADTVRAEFLRVLRPLGYEGEEAIAAGRAIARAIFMGTAGRCPPTKLPFTADERQRIGRGYERVIRRLEDRRAPSSKLAELTRWAAAEATRNRGDDGD